MKLNLGCFDKYLDGWVNLDICEPADVIHDLNVYPWPFEDQAFESVRAWDILEHLPVEAFFRFMNECHRILLPLGTLDIIVPTPSDNFWLDPTHVRPYLGETFSIFCTGAYEGTWIDIKPWTGVKHRPLERPQVPAVQVVLIK